MQQWMEGDRGGRGRYMNATVDVRRKRRREREKRER